MELQNEMGILTNGTQKGVRSSGILLHSRKVTDRDNELYICLKIKLG